MTIQITYGEPDKTYTKVYRKVYAGKNLAQYVEGFYSNRGVYKWGVMVQLKGNDIIMLHKFGNE